MDLGLLVEVSGGRGGRHAEESLREAVDEALADASMASHRKVTDAYGGALGEGRAVHGIPAVTEAFASGAVETLLLSADRAEDPMKWASPDDPRLSASAPRGSPRRRRARSRRRPGCSCCAPPRPRTRPSASCCRARTPTKAALHRLSPRTRTRAHAHARARARARGLGERPGLAQQCATTSQYPGVGSCRLLTTLRL
jgi:hypothetical protein